MSNIPIPVQQQFTNEQKQELIALWHSGKTQVQIAKKFGVPRRTIMKLCKHLGLKRSTKATADLVIKSPLDKPEIINKIRELRQTHSLEEIAQVVGGSPTAVCRMCKKYGIKLDRNSYATIQAKRMKAAWTEERRNELSGSKFPQLNDPKWLKEHYIDKDMSMSEIAKMTGIPVSTIAHHLKRHKIPIRSKDKIYAKLKLKALGEH